MTIFLSDIQDKISSTERERMRLQKLLSVILPVDETVNHSIALRRVLQDSYERLGYPLEWLRKRGLLSSFEKLLDAFGFLPLETLNDEEKEQLIKNPYTVWPNERHCFLNGDALPFLAQDKELKKQNYLCFALQKLDAREIKHWCRWLGLGLASSSQRARTLLLYRHLAYLHYQQKQDNPSLEQEICLAELPTFLDEVFPDDPSYCPLAWFYRDVLSFYRALEETEKRLEQFPVIARLLVTLFKSGRLVISPVTPQLGHALRWRIVTTKEKGLCFRRNDDTFDYQPIIEEKDQHQKMLF